MQAYVFGNVLKMLRMTDLFVVFPFCSSTVLGSRVVSVLDSGAEGSNRNRDAVG